MGSPSEQHVTAQTWLATFSNALSSNDPRAVASMFLPFGWLRDVLTFVWDNRSLNGPDQITSYLSEDDRLTRTQVTAITLDDDLNFQPATTTDPNGDPGIEFGFIFETPIAHGRGFARLRQDAQAQWKALTVFMMVSDLKGHEERKEQVDFETDGKTWSKVFHERKAQVEMDPYVLIGMRSLHSFVHSLTNTICSWRGSGWSNVGSTSQSNGRIRASLGA